MAYAYVAHEICIRMNSGDFEEGQFKQFTKCPYMDMESHDERREEQRKEADEVK